MTAMVLGVVLVAAGAGLVGLVGAQRVGVPPGTVQSRQPRPERRQRAERRAQHVPVRTTLPLVLSILPWPFVAVPGPEILSVMDNLA